jgi:dihydrofolate synthase / folylpolyglutamate synthase
MTRDLKHWLIHLETLHPQWIDLGLDRIVSVAQRCGVFPFTTPVITIAGTNGKGSCAHLLERIFLSSNYRVGLYTSPHLLHYHERFRCNGQYITDAVLCEIFNQIEQTRASISLTYFEFSTLAALLWFKRFDLDLVILEVGMGGRLDAVNILDADVALISTVDLDHTQWLGHTREAIAYEKAGILREHKPCVFGQSRVPESLRAYAKKLNASLWIAREDFFSVIGSSTWSWWNQRISLECLPLPQIEVENAAAVLQTIDLLRDRFPVSRDAIEQGLKFSLPGRFQKINLNQRIVILDVAHNPEATRLLAKNLRRSKNYPARTWAVLGMCSDKDIRATLSPMIPEIDVWCVAPFNQMRSASASILKQHLDELTQEQIFVYDSIEDAFTDAKQRAKSNDWIVVFGSFYTVSAVLRILKYKTQLSQDTVYV